ncbi:MAG: transglutaminase family protein [Novosphingobium sp.]
MLLSIQHVTSYRFEHPVAHGLQRLRLRPKPSHGQTVLDWDMTLEGVRFEAEYDDHNHNHTTLVSVEPGAQGVTIACTGMVETADRAGIVGPHMGNLPLWALLGQTPLTRPGPRMRAFCQGFAGGGDKVDMLHRLSQAILGEVRYQTGATDAATTAEEAMVAGTGVCQDHTHLFLGCARAMGVPARYVSGYLMMDDRVEQEAGHAWAEAHVEGIGWVGFDVANGISPDARYVRVATGHDYREAAPVTGLSYGAGDSDLRVRLAVEQQTAEQ